MSNDMFKYYDRHPQNDVVKDKTDEDGNVVNDVLGNPIKVPLSEYDLARKANDKALQETLSTLETAYGTSKKNILNNYTKAVSDADLVRNIASKYLPEQMARMGWDTNLGATTSGANQIMANYGSDINSANETKANAMSELDIYMSDKANEARALRDSASATVDAEERAQKRSQNETIVTSFINEDKFDFNTFKEAYNTLDDFTKQNLLGGGISVDNASVTSFGTFKGTGEGGTQDKYITNIINSAKDGKIPPGTVINFNYGNGTPANYIFLDGRFYKTTKTATIHDDLSSLQGTIYAYPQKE